MSSQAWEDYAVPGSPVLRARRGRRDPRRGRGDDLGGAGVARRRRDRGPAWGRRAARGGGDRPRPSEPVPGTARDAERPCCFFGCAAAVTARSRPPGRPEASRCSRASPRSGSGAGIRTGRHGHRVPARRHRGGGRRRRGCSARSASVVLPATRRRCAVLLARARGGDRARRAARAVPGPRRQVDERWLDEYRGWVYGAGYGAQLGLGVTTVVSSAATYVALLAAFLTGERSARARSFSAATAPCAGSRRWRRPACAASAGCSRSTARWRGGALGRAGARWRLRPGSWFSRSRCRDA